MNAYCLLHYSALKMGHYYNAELTSLLHYSLLTTHYSLLTTHLLCTISLTHFTLTAKPPTMKTTCWHIAASR